jgi:hypothetical protein
MTLTLKRGRYLGRQRKNRERDMTKGIERERYVGRERERERERKKHREG